MSVILMPHARDHARVEKALPGFMFALAFESLMAEGYEVRMDLVELANKASAVALEGTLGAHTQKLAKIIADDGYYVMKHAGTDDVKLLIGGMARLFPKLQDEGIDVDKDGLLVALGIAAEIDDGVKDWGSVNQINPVMARLAKNCREKGVFLHHDGIGAHAGELTRISFDTPAPKPIVEIQATEGKMQQAKSVADMKSAIKAATKVYMWIVFGQSAEGNTPLGGFAEIYKTHALSLLAPFALSTSKYDTKVRCFYRLDEETNFLYIEGFKC